MSSDEIDGTGSELQPLETLYDASPGRDVSLPAELAAAYGSLRLRSVAGRPLVIGNFVTTLDGVVALNVPGKLTGGGEIAGPEPHDHMVMGLLRAMSDVIVVGAETARAAPSHLWTPEHVYPRFADAYRQLRNQLAKKPAPLTVIVTASGQLDPRQAVFRIPGVPYLILTTEKGLKPLETTTGLQYVQAVLPETSEPPSARAIIEAIRNVVPADIILTEGGPRLIGGFFADQLLDELFLTLAPQIAGRDDSAERPGLVAGTRFAPEHPLWGTLAGVKRGSSHLFLRYSFDGA